MSTENNTINNQTREFTQEEKGYKHPTTILEFESVYRQEYEQELESCDRWINWCKSQNPPDTHGMNFHQGLRGALVFNNIKMEQLLRVLKQEYPNESPRTAELASKVEELEKDVTISHEFLDRLKATTNLGVPNNNRSPLHTRVQWAMIDTEKVVKERDQLQQQLSIEQSKVGRCVNLIEHWIPRLNQAFDYSHLSCISEEFRNLLQDLPNTSGNLVEEIERLKHAFSNNDFVIKWANNILSSLPTQTTNLVEENRRLKELVKRMADFIDQVPTSSQIFTDCLQALNTKTTLLTDAQQTLNKQG